MYYQSRSSSSAPAAPEQGREAGEPGQPRPSSHLQRSMRLQDVKKWESQMSPGTPAWARRCSACDCSGIAEKGPAGATNGGSTEEAGLRPGPTGV